MPQLRGKKTHEVWKVTVNHGLGGGLGYTGQHLHFEDGVK